MKILFLSLTDFESVSEKTIYTDLLREFLADGNDIYAISPSERRKKTKTRVIADGRCTILKPQIGNIQKTNYIEKGVSTLLVEKQIINAIKKYFGTVKFDLVLYATPPVTFQKAISFVKNRDHANTYLMLKDIWPQGLIDLGILKTTGWKGMIYRYFKHKERKLYLNSDFIGCMTEGNKKYLLRHNNYLNEEQIEICPNCMEPSDKKTTSERKLAVRKKYEIPEEACVYLYGGNLGKPQGLDFLLKIIQTDKNGNNFYLIVGDGTEYPKLEQAVLRGGFKNVKLMHALPKRKYESLLETCDVGLIFLNNRFTIPNFPSRLLSYMDAELPVLAATDVHTDLKEIIETGKFGFWCENGDLASFIKYTEKLQNKKLRDNLGENSRKYLLDNYSAHKVYENMKITFSKIK